MPFSYAILNIIIPNTLTDFLESSKEPGPLVKHPTNEPQLESRGHLKGYFRLREKEGTDM